LRRAAERARRAPADAVFLVLWLSADAALAIAGDRLDALQGLVVGVVLLALIRLTRGFTPPPQALPLPRNALAGRWPTASRRKRWPATRTES
jgi:hypothetical protein